MSYPSLTTTLISLLSIAFLVQTTIANEDDPQLYHFCSSSAGNYTNGSSSQVNLIKLLSLLQYKTPPFGYAQASTGRHNDQVYGLALCRGDVHYKDCQTCVANASTELVKLCSYDKGAIIWYDYCMVKYLNRDFFGQIDNQNKFYMWNVESIGNDTKSFNQKVKKLLSQLSQEASMTPKLYGVGEMKFNSTTTLYGLAQCTRDLSSNDCKSCLDEAISELPDCCDGKKGGRVVGGSCNVRYEIYPFVMS